MKALAMLEQGACCLALFISISGRRAASQPIAVVDHLEPDRGPEGAEQERRQHRRQHQDAQKTRGGRRTFWRTRNDNPVLALRAHAEWKHGEQHDPPQQHVDGDGERRGHGAQACSISISVPLKSFGCRNSTGLPCAPILGSPSPSTRAPEALSLALAARISSTS